MRWLAERATGMVAWALVPAFLAYEIGRWAYRPTSTNQEPRECAGAPSRMPARTAVVATSARSLASRSATAATIPSGLPLSAEDYEHLTEEGDSEIKLPDTAAGVQKLLRKFGHVNLAVESFDQPQFCRIVEDGAIEMRAHVYCLTPPQLKPGGQMKQDAVTIVLRYVDEHVTTQQLDGWQLPDPWISAA